MATDPITAFETRLHKQYPHLSSLLTILSSCLTYFLSLVSLCLSLAIVWFYQTQRCCGCHVPSARRYDDAMLVAVVLALAVAAPTAFASSVAAAACATASAAAAAAHDALCAAVFSFV